jgi:hypothetical protein
VAEIADVERFGSTVEKRLATWTYPPISGVRVEAVENPENRGRGVVGVYVSRSDAGPHRVTSATRDVNDKYYMRAAAGSLVMPHSQLEAAFAYALPPRLEFRARFLAWDVNNEKLGPLVELRLANRGRSPARRPAVDLLGPPPLKWRQPPETFGIQQRCTEEGMNYAALEPLSADFVIYPGSDAVLATARCERAAFTQSGGISLHFVARVMSLNSQTFEGGGYLNKVHGEPPESATLARVVIAATVT